MAEVTCNADKFNLQQVRIQRRGTPAPHCCHQRQTNSTSRRAKAPDAALPTHGPRLRKRGPAGRPRWAVGAIACWRRLITVVTASIAPPAPIKWPCMDLVALTGNDCGELAKNRFQRGNFGRVALQRGGAVRIHITNVLQVLQPAIFQCGADGPHLALSFRAHQMAAIAAGAIPDHFCVDARAALHRMVPVFQHQCGRTLAKHQPPPVCGKGTAGRGRGRSRRLARSAAWHPRPGPRHRSAWHQSHR